MSDYKLTLPSMGEGVMEATITNWLKNVGDVVKEDESVIEIATDKVDSDVPSPVSGILKKILIPINGVVKVNEAFAILTIENNEDNHILNNSDVTDKENKIFDSTNLLNEKIDSIKTHTSSLTANKFYSPLVKSIVEKEELSDNEIENIIGTGKNGRITKDDILNYVNHKKNIAENNLLEVPKHISTPISQQSNSNIIENEGDEIIEMDRMRKIIAQNMVQAKQIAPHVTSFVEADITNIVLWRNKYKEEFSKKYGEKITFMPIFIEAVTKAIQDFPMINISVNGDKIIKKKNINIGIAAALPTGNLIVPVIKNANQYNLAGLARQVNDLANRSRSNKLKPAEILGGTYTITNIGTFGNIMGTPIIPQPQVAILAIGSIVKKPAVVETEQGDMIAIRNKIYLSHSYDHRIVDGALGCMFVKRVAEYLESFQINTPV